MATGSKSFSVELRIHGVSGTPPQDMLGSEHVKQVAGDDRGRFFRPCGSDQSEIQSDPERVPAGYHLRACRELPRRRRRAGLRRAGLREASAERDVKPRGVRRPGRMA